MGPTRIARAVAHLGSPDRIFEAPLTELEAAGMPARAAQFCFDGRARAAAEQEVRRMEEAGGTFVTLCGCRPIRTPCARSTIRLPSSGFAAMSTLLSQPGIAVVGTRHPSPYGSGMAEMLSRDLAAAAW